MEKVKLKKGLKCAMSISSKGNAYLQETQFWKLYKEDQPSCSIVMKTAVGVVHILACSLQPFMPSFTVEVFKQLNLPHQELVLLSDEKGDVDRARRPWEIVPAGHKIGEPKPLFEELSSERLEELKNKYSKKLSAEDEAEQLNKTKISGSKNTHSQTSR